MENKTIFCAFCGKPANEDQAFCMHCGKPLSKPVENTAPETPVAPETPTAPASPVAPATPVPGQFIAQQPVAAKPKKKGGKKVVAIIAAVLVFIIAFISVSCLEQDDVEGTYSGSYTYNGNSYSVGLVLGEDGKFAKATYKNGRYYKMETGYYEVKGGRVECHPTSSIGTTPYQYVFGKLENNGHYLTKKSD